jgi:hypothetical protein
MARSGRSRSSTVAGQLQIQELMRDRPIIIQEATGQRMIEFMSGNLMRMPSILRSSDNPCEATVSTGNRLPAISQSTMRAAREPAQQPKVGDRRSAPTR